MISPTSPPALRVRSLSVSRANASVLTEVSLEIVSGGLAWVEGASGSGKSTLLRAVAGLLPFNAGEMLCGGTPSQELAPHRWRRKVLLLPQPLVPLGPTIRDDLKAPFALKIRGGEAPPDDAVLGLELEGMGLTGLGLGRSTAELSQGQFARLAILRSILALPEVLLLDEPTANLDGTSARFVAERVQSFVQAGGAALVAAHSEPWEGVDCRYRIEEGRLMEVPQ